MKLLAFAATTSKKSINKQVINYAKTLIEGGLLEDATVEVLDLNDFEMPIYSIDREEESGIPAEAKAFHAAIAGADAIMISFAEHNGTFSAAYKNVFDWTSRIDAKVYQGKPGVFFATSPGGRGGKGVLDAAVGSAPHHGLDLKASLPIPSFYKNFDPEAGAFRHAEIDDAFRDALGTLR